MSKLVIWGSGWGRGFRSHRLSLQRPLFVGTPGTVPTPSPPIKSLGFEGFDSSRLLILRGGILMSVDFDRGSPGKFDSRTLNRETPSRGTGRNQETLFRKPRLASSRLFRAVKVSRIYSFN